jgi:predicted ATPase/class 3 adenylate cyclase
MNLQLTGYKGLEILHTGMRTLVYRGQRASDGKPVLLKLPRAEYPSPQQLDHLRAEYAILAGFSRPNVVRALALEPHGNHLVLVLEDIGGVKLSQLLKSALDVRSFLELAIPLAEALQAVHDGRAIHKDINPENVVINPRTRQLQIIDFGLAVPLPKGSQIPVTPGVLEGTLAFMSPEQTGRMNRSLDHRTDLYSLGITFYQMLCGRRPFDSTDPMELVHGHLAWQPLPPSRLVPSLPEVLSRLVLRLLAKTAEERYQSAAGVAADLKCCLSELEARGAIGDFELGAEDFSERLQIPDKLYGRDAEVEQLLGAFHRATSGQVSLMLVAGYSGVGKSRLVNEVQRPIVERGGYFVSGKFDQFKRDVPFASLHEAFRRLMRQLLAEPEEKVARWKARLGAALGANGRLISEVVPEVEMLLGPQPPVGELPPLESQHRFRATLQAFVRAFCQPEHPLCLFLDDLQWVDSATLQWLETTLAERDLNHLFLIGAYRDNEITPAHPMRLALERLRERNAAIQELVLPPLAGDTLTRMVADTLRMAPERCADLSQLLHSKTAGNPFFVTQSLRTLLDDGAIRFDRPSRGWSYDIEKARGVRISDNVVELLAARLQRLPAASREVLQLGACVGSAFTLQELERLSGRERKVLREELWEALSEGLVFQGQWGAGGELEYRFLHDRIQQAAHSLNTPEQTRQARLRLGRGLIERSKDPATDDQLFDMVGHLNAARELITDTAEREQLARLNLAAATRARQSTAYVPALGYVTTAMQLLPESAFGLPSALTRDLLLERAECEHLCGHADEAERFFDQALAHAGSDLEQARVYEKKVHFFTNLARFPDAYATGREAVGKLGIRLPASFVPPLFLADFAKAKLLLRGRKVADLVHLPEMKDERLRVAVRLIAAVLKAAYQIRPELCVANAAKMVNLCLKHGNTADSPIGYLVLGGIFMGGVLGNHQSGYEFGQLALGLIERFKNLQQKAEVNFVYGYFAHSWVRPATETEEYWRVAYQAGVDSGDTFHTSCASMGTLQSMYMRGVPLETVDREGERFLRTLERLQNREGIATVRGIRQAIRNLRGGTREPGSFDGPGFDERAFEEELRTFGSRHFAHYYFINKMQTLYLWGEHARALEVAEASEKYRKDSTGMLHGAEDSFLHALIAAALHPAAERARKRVLEARIRKSHRAFVRYAADCKENFAHKERLLAALLASLSGEAVAERLFTEAINLAQAHGYPQIAAIAAECAARLHLRHGAHLVARAYLREALHGFRTWGATGKVAALEREFPSLGISEDLSEGSRTTTTTTTTTTSAGQSTLDLGTVLKVASAISGEIVLNRLLSRLMQLLIENAGAERGVFLMPEGELLRVHARGTTHTQEVLQPPVPMDPATVCTTVVSYVARTREFLVLGDASRDGLTARDAYVLSRGTRSVLCAPVVHQGKLAAVIYLENDLAPSAFTPERLEVIRLLASHTSTALENARLYADLQAHSRELARFNSSLTRFVPNEFLSSLGKSSIVDVQLGESVRKEMTVLFSDIRGFTPLVEGMSPQQHIGFINTYLSHMEPPIINNGGFVDSYIGDAIMALFDGGPDRAVRASIGMSVSLQRFNEEREKTGLKPVRMGVGLNTGTLTLGTIGGPMRIKCGVIGDTVNLASRVESLTKRYGAFLLLSHHTLERLEEPARFAVRVVDRVTVKGKSVPVTLYEVLDAELSAARDAKLASLSSYTAAVEHYYRGEFGPARELFTECLARNPGDIAAQGFRARCDRYLAQGGAPEGWTGVEALDHK